MTWDGTDRRPQMRSTDSQDTRDIVIATHTQVQALTARILGNGSPGALELINDDLSALDTRLAAVEGWKRWVNGVSAAVGGIVAVIASFWKWFVIVRIKGE